MLMGYEVVNESAMTLSRGTLQICRLIHSYRWNLPAFPEGHRGNSEFNQPLPSESLGVN